MKVKVNSAKLESMGLEKAKAACLIHANKAIQHMHDEDKTLFEMHIALLDRCAEVGRKLKQAVEVEQQWIPTAEELIGHALAQ
jgi:hypothetical protein